MDGQNYVNEIAFSQPVINIGADSGNDIILRGQGIADFHLMLNYASNVWHAVPLDPSYTTLVNGRGIGSEGCPVQNGAVLSIGDYRLTLSLNGTYADILVNQLVSAIPNQSAPVVTEESEGSSILLSLSDKLVPAEIEAGITVEYELTVTNAGPLVANMQLQLQGIPSAWVQIIPPVLNLNEGRSGNFVVRVSPPRTSAAKAGFYQLHFVALSPNYPRETGTADTALTILPYNDFLVNGPTPRRLNLSRSHPSDFADLNIINNSNAAASFVIRSYDDANEMNYAYRQDAGNLTQGQISVTVNPGDNDRVPIQVEARKRPLIGLTSHMHHYYTSVTPTDRPGDAQTLLGEVSVRPMIHVIWLVIILLVLALAALIIFQPRIHQFDSLAGKRTEVILAGNSMGINWDVSRFASRITLFDGKEERQVSRQGNEFLSPDTSTTYTLKAENFLSNLLGFKHEKQFRLLLIPRRPTIDVFKTDTVRTNYTQPVRLDWAVSTNADTAVLVTNKQSQSLAAENYSGNQSNNYASDALISLKASNASGYEEKSVFVNVDPDKIDLIRFIAWVRPNGIAVPSNNDVRRATRWGSLQLYAAATPAPQTIRQAVNPQPDVQSNVISIPDNFAMAGSAQGGVSPEQQSVNRILAGSGSDGLLVGPYTDALPTSTPAPTAVPTAAAVSVRSPIVSSSSSASSTSPEGGSANREFSIKLVEAVEDPLSESGYRIIEYFPDYVLQKGEQIRIEWEVEGVPQVTIDNLSSDSHKAVGAEFAYPEKSTNYVLNAEAGNLKKSYSLPVNVAGDPDDGEESGLNCNLKANSTTLAVPGTIMLTWTGGGNNRVQLLSSIKAEEDNAKAEKQKEIEAKEKGETYTRPTNAPLSGGIIGDYLQPSGFMRVNVDKQTTFVLNAYDGNGNVICSKDVEVKYTGGNDKLDLKMAITKIADEKDVSQPYYTVGQTVQFTVALTDYKSGMNPTGSVMLTDGDSTCTMTLPKNTCSMVMKHTGTRTITAVYGGDDAYNKKTATGSLSVRSKIDTDTLITSAFKTAADMANLETKLDYSSALANQFGKTPTGKITFTAGSGTCDLDLSTLDLSCGGEGTKSGNTYTLEEMLLSDEKAKKVQAKYSGDDYFNPSTSDIVLFETVPTKIDFMAFKPIDVTHAQIHGVITWDDADNVRQVKPTGTVSFKAGSGDACVLNLEDGSMKCPSYMSAQVEPWKEHDAYLEFNIYDMFLEDSTAEMITAEYSGDGYFESSDSKTKFGQNAVELVIVKVTDTAEKEHSFYPSTGYKALVEVDLKDPGAVTKPTGNIVITVNGDPSSRCTVAWGSETKCQLTLPKTAGERIPVVARYEGDALYGSRTAQTTIEIRDQQKLKPVIKKITDKNGSEQEEEYFKNEEIWVYVDLEDYVEAEIPTGIITVKVAGKTCVIEYDDTNTSPTGKYCKLDVPGGSGDQTLQDVNADYAGNPFYKAASAEKKQIKVVNKYQVDFIIEKVRNECDVAQPYYVFDPDADSGSGKGQTVIVTWGLTPIYPSGISSTPPEPKGNVTVLADNGEGKKPLEGCELVPWESQSCSFTVTKITGEFTLIARYEGDDYHVKRDATWSNFVTHNRIKTVTTMKPGTKWLEDYSKADWEVEFSYSDTFADEHGVSWKKGLKGLDYVAGDCKKDVSQEITFTYVDGSGTDKKSCSLDLDTNAIDCGGTATFHSDTKEYNIEKASLLDDGGNIIDVDKVRANYSGNIYFAPSAGENRLLKENSGETQIELKDLLQVNTQIQSHAFFAADLTYAEVKNLDGERQKPVGELQIDFSGGGSPISCTYPMGDPSFSCNGTTVSVVPDDIESNVIRYTFYNFLLGDPPTAVTVKYLSANNYFQGSQNDGTLTTEGMPEVHISAAEKTAADKADLEFSAGTPGSLSEHYGVYDKLRFGAEKDAEGSDARYALASLDTLQFESGGSGTLTRTGTNYKLKDWTDTFRKEYFYCSVRLTGPYFSMDEGPLDRVKCTIQKITVTGAVKDRVQFKTTHGFATVELNYDKSQASAFDVTPTGDLKIHLAYMSGSGSRNEYKTCTYKIETGENDCGAVVTRGRSDNGKTTVILKNFELGEYNYVSHQIKVEYDGDDYFKSCVLDDYRYLTSESPSVTLLSAKKTTAGDCGELKYRVYYGYGHNDKLAWAEKYGIISKFEAYAVISDTIPYSGSSSSGSGVHTMYDIWNYPHFYSIYKGSLSRVEELYGDVFTLRWCRPGFTELNDKKYAYIGLYSQYLGYSEPFTYDPWEKPMAFVIDDSISSSSVSSASTLSASPVSLSVSIGD
ncbi:MAG: Ig-like domain repeat protein [Flexilinea sp.]|nr:Ig-like domain repeat protein [Flexilinea sp.]